MKKFLIAVIMIFCFSSTTFAAEENEYVLINEFDRVPENGTVVIHFNTEMDFYTLFGSVRVTTSTGQEVDAYIGLDLSMKSLLITPKNSWGKGRSYVVYIENDIKGLNKNPLQQKYMVKFKTEPMKGKIVQK